MELPARSLRLGGGGSSLLLFLPGFLAPPSAYRSLLAPVAAGGVEVVVPALYRPGPAVLSGRLGAGEEAERAVVLGRRLAADGRPLWIAGHSRGGLVAWMASAGLPVHGVALLDPVAGGAPWLPPGPLPVGAATAPVLIVGCGRAGRCAPSDRDHATFARAIGRAEVVLLADAGHADLLDGLPGRFGSLVCAVGADPARTRAGIAALLTTFLAGGDGPAGDDPPTRK